MLSEWRDAEFSNRHLGPLYSDPNTTAHSRKILAPDVTQLAVYAEPTLIVSELERHAGPVCANGERGGFDRLALLRRTLHEPRRAVDDTTVIVQRSGAIVCGERDAQLRDRFHDELDSERNSKR